ncbi:MAG: type IV pilus assembly protein PilE [Gallionellaceae bacterium]|nr:MAG: type IV pilus assembly protein PilE [Gallionellaceae bacterium]
MASRFRNQGKKMKYYSAKGFSLIELMIAVVIVGIIAAIAVPSYSSYLVKSSRAAAQTELLEMASLQEKIFLNSNNYTPNVASAYTGSAAGGLGKTTAKTSDGKYDLSIDITTPSQTYEMRAEPVGGSAQLGDGCILIRENGLRQWHQGSDDCTAASPVAW